MLSHKTIYEYPHPTVEILLGKTLTAIDVNTGDNEIAFTDSNGNRYLMYHNQDCCESVTINDVSGEWSDLIGSPLLMAEEVSNQKEVEYGSETWTFYKFGTVKGYVTLRWYGESNGYYSESVDFGRLKDETP